jgi:hypothetical protein
MGERMVDVQFELTKLTHREREREIERERRWNIISIVYRMLEIY